MAEVSIGSALAKLEADTDRVRNEGLGDLRRILSHGRNTTKLRSVGDEQFHTIFELLYQIARKEKQAYLRASKPTSKHNAASRLAGAGAALRLVVEFGVTSIKFKTAVSVLDHILDTLPTSDQGFCEPLKIDYLKSFRLLLDHGPHGEHLRPKQWQTYVDFVLQVVGAFLEDIDSEEGLTGRGSTMSSRSGLHLSVRPSQRSGRASPGVESTPQIDEAMGALRGLTAVTNAPLMSRSTHIAETLVDFLHVGTRAQETAFESLNNVVAVALTEDVQFTQNLLTSLAPIIRRLWSSKSAALREQMLIFLSSSRTLFIASNHVWPRMESSLLEQLLATLLSDYSVRAERDLLHFDDVRIVSDGNLSSSQLQQLAPLRNSSRAMTTWTTLGVIACLTLSLSSQQRAYADLDGPEESSRKRRRVQTPVEDILHRAERSSGQEKLVALQLLLFLFDQPLPVPEDVIDRVADLVVNLTDEDPNIQSWAHLLFSRWAIIPRVRQRQTSEFWDQVWTSARRALSMTATVRAACKLLASLITTKALGSLMNAKRIIGTLFGQGNDGPCILTDTSLLLFTTALRSDIFEHERTFQMLSLKVVSWLAAHWTLQASTLDRLHNAQMAFHARPEYLYDMLAVICGTPPCSKQPRDWSPSHLLGTSSWVVSENLAFVQYLLGVEARASVQDGDIVKRASRQLDPSTCAGLSQAVSDMLTTKLKDFQIAWEALISERASNISPDIIDIVASACLVSSAAETALRAAIGRSFQPPADVWDTLCRFISDHADETFRSIVARVSSSVVRLLQQVPTQDLLSIESTFAVVESTLALVRQGILSEGAVNALDADFMDSMGTGTPSQSSQSSSGNVGHGLLRRDLPLNHDIPSQLARYSVELLIDQQMIKSGPLLDSQAASAVIDHILSLNPHLLLAARGAVVDFLNTKSSLSRDDACRLLVRLAKTCLQDDALNRCEPALCFCVNVLTALTDLWISDEEDDLAETAFDIYSWYLNIALGKGIASPKVLLSISELLEVVLQTNPLYGTDDIQSPRTSLLQILQIGGAGLQFRLAPKLSHLFERYVLTEHEAIFDDIVENLPTDPDHKEGIGARLYIVAELGGRWHTVLRQATYHLFETVAHVPSTIDLGRDCIRRACTALGLESSQDLFKLFCPQILYTWLGKGDISTIPFSAFGYSSLRELALDNLNEIVGQVALRGSTHAQELVQIVVRSWESLLEGGFAHAEAYTLASETSLPQQDRLYDGSERLIRKQLGPEAFIQQLRDSMADIIVQLIVSLQDERGIDKALERAQQMSARSALKEMSDRSNSSIVLPFAQQPSFRAKYLIEELQYLYSRLNVEPAEVWTSALLIHVYRSLLDHARPALGPLHACAVIRKLRVAISLAGPVALSGYPLEMLLHNLRSYLTIFDCSQDTIGIYCYLLDHGKDYLQSRLSFIAGLGVSIFASLTGFVTSSQESTTQESDFLSTITKAQEFRSWLGSYFDTLAPYHAAEETVSRFRHIVQFAKSLTRAGNSAKSSSEGSLLHSLLIDRSSSEPLLTDLHFDLSLQILCKDFSPATSWEDDILSQDEDCALFAPVLSSVLSRLVVNDDFRIWAAEAIGRGYAIRGTINKVPATEEAHAPHPSSGANRALTAVASYSKVLQYLEELLWNGDFKAARFAERTLQLMLTALDRREEHALFGSDIDRARLNDFRYLNVPCPQLSTPPDMAENSLEALDHWLDKQSRNTWASDLVVALCQYTHSDPILAFLGPLVFAVPTTANTLLPYVVHLVLVNEFNGHQVTRERLSTLFSNMLQTRDQKAHENCRLVLNTILYLRRCCLPNETTTAQRNLWLDIDFGQAACVAVECRMWHAALLFLELHHSQANLKPVRSSRRSFVDASTLPVETVSMIYQNVEDPDFFYGNHEDTDMTSVIKKLRHEGVGHKALSFQSALFDAVLRDNVEGDRLSTAAQGTASTLSAVNMEGIARALSEYVEYLEGASTGEKIPASSINLHQWDVLSSTDRSRTSTNILGLFDAISTASSKNSIVSSLDQTMLGVAKNLFDDGDKIRQQSQMLAVLAVVAEVRQMMSITTSESVGSLSHLMVQRNDWAKHVDFDNISPLLLGREAWWAALKRNKYLQDAFSLTPPQTLLLEIQAVRESLRMAQSHDVPQFCLNRAMYLSELSEAAATLGLKVDVAIQYDLAKTLWAQEEIAGSIRILHHLSDRQDLADQAIVISKAEILKELGHKVAEARLERADEIITSYLVPALKELHGQSIGSEAGRVFHHFAAFCDMQLQDNDNLDDFTRVGKIRDRKLREVQDLERMIKNSEGKVRDQLRVHHTKAKTWFKLDDEEWQRVQANREDLILKCLENYLLSMRACDDYPNDTLRLLALWLNQAENPRANASVRKYLHSVPTVKFAPLVNQLSSRILDTKDDFQQLLLDLMFRICSDHPYHSLYQLFATSKSKGAKTDDVANSRYAAANRLADLINRKSPSNSIWVAIHNSNIAFVRLAQERLSDKDVKTGSKIPLRKLLHGQKLEQVMNDAHTKIPPPTMRIVLRPDRDYSSVPKFTKFDPEMSIAGGVSAPKIATIIASDGSRHKMLLKGGNDDLRQDSIMEQVFEQVSNLLKDHRATRQRHLGIRTYKVIPLTTNAGIIEFVKDTIPLHDYLLPAHTRYFPKDYKPNRCRKEISDAQTKPLMQRLQAYRTVTANFHPVMRFFFMEYFLDPDEWFHKRLNYSRSTAAISILGHVLGLGDRHGHNILLDENSGEVVHIDLGVAFEAGRVLPVPEVVPFRLTRDLVDGMGLTGVEGVFRRCCYFTLEALRQDQEAIMTILDVLRYDPLYSWSVSPLRLQKMQEHNEQTATTHEAGADGENDGLVASGVGLSGGGKRDVGEPSEADRALTVVAKKLGKSLSVEATVNELIRQATDERNLAVLYCGWAAYA